MPIKPGDHVRFLREKQEGTVLRLLPGNKAEVLVDDFLEIEVGLDEIVPVAQGEELLRRPGEGEKNASTPQAPQRQTEPELLVCRDEEGDHQIWFIAGSAHDWAFAIFARIGSRYRKLNAGLIHSGEKLFIGKLTAAEAHETKALYFQGLPVPSGESGKPSPLHAIELPFRLAVFNTKPADLPEVNRKGHRFALMHAEELLPGPDAEKDQPPVRVELNEVIDLHIEALVNEVGDMDSLTMLDIQMKAFEKHLDNARLHGLRKIIFIHGVGNGVLKKEIIMRLARYPFIQWHKPADSMQFGNGALEVQLK